MNDRPQSARVPMPTPRRPPKARRPLSTEERVAVVDALIRQVRILSEGPTGRRIRRSTLALDRLVRAVANEVSDVERAADALDLLARLVVLVNFEAQPA